MIPLIDAKKIVLDATVGIHAAIEEVNLIQSNSRVLAEDILSDIDFPPFTKSNMDGYACKRSDLHRPLLLKETIMAGIMPEERINSGECSKIMTGAQLPEGAECIFIVEESEQLPNQIIRFTGKDTENFITHRGDFLKKGDTVLAKGTLIRPQEVSTLAAVGKSKVKVYQPPKIGVISTGDELVEPDTIPQNCQLRDSNSSQLCAQIERAGGTYNYYGIARDDYNDICSRFEKAVEENELVLLTGGVSMGDLDLVKKMLREKCQEIYFEKIKVKPGKPTIFGRFNEKFIFGLPGNPVSSYVIFELLVRPVIERMINLQNKNEIITMPLGKELSFKKNPREQFIPVRLENGKVLPISYEGSGHLNALTKAFGLISIPVDTTSLDKGTLVDVRPV